MLRFATSRRIMSPFLTSASGPPTADSGVMCSTMVPNAVPLMRASDIRTMSLTPPRASFFGDRQITRLRHAGCALGAGIAQHQHVVGVDVEIGIVDPQRHVLDGFEHHGAPGMLQQFRARRRLLDDGSARREVAVQHRHRAFFLDRIVARTDGILSRHILSTGDNLAQRLSCDGLGVEIDEVAELSHQFRHAAGMMEVLHVMLARRFQIDQHRHLAAKPVECLRDRSCAASDEPLP